METLIAEFAKPEAEQDKELLLNEFLYVWQTHDFNPTKLKSWEDVQELVNLCMDKRYELSVQMKALNPQIEPLLQEYNTFGWAMEDADRWLDLVSDQ
jgi:hypothetical protein